MQKSKIILLKVTVSSRVTSVPSKVKSPEGIVTTVFRRKRYLDAAVGAAYDTGTFTKDTFTAHVYRGELRIMVQATSRADERSSMSETDFARYCERRYQHRAAEVTAAFAELTPKK